MDNRDLSAVLDRVEARLPRLRRYARQRCGEAASADMLVKAALEAVLARPRESSPDRLLARCYREIRRRAGPLSERPGMFHPDPGAARAGASDPMLRALAALDAFEREALFLLLAEGFDESDAAAILDIGRDALRERLETARAKLLRASTAAHDGRFPTVPRFVP